jgi:hypothetical protein
MVLAADESQQAPQRYGKYVMSPQAAPDACEFLHAGGIGRGRKISGVKRTHGRADDKVSVEAVTH